MITKLLSGEPGIKTATYGYQRTGCFIIAAGLAGFLLWAGFAPLDQGIAASGTVVIAGNIKQVQSPADGVISDIYVQNGQRAEKDQVLVRLRPVQSQAQAVSLAEQLDSTLLIQRRLEAELRGEQAFTPAADEIFYAPPDYRQAQLQVQNALLADRRLELESDIQARQITADGPTQRLITLRDIARSSMRQSESLTAQAANLKSLADEGFLPRHRYLEIQRESAALRNQADDTRLQISRAEEEKATLTEQITQRMAAFHSGVREELSRLSVQRSELKKQQIIEDDRLEQHEITAPVAGTIMDLSVFTAGGVVRAGEKLMSVVPEQQTLIIEGKLSPQWIDKVAPGQSADLLFTAFNQNLTPKLRGELTMISADRLINPANGEPYYQIQIAVPETAAAQVIKPGMPAEIFIRTGERSLLSYLFKPVTDRLFFALTEE
ncbi:secretion protein HlyD [Morganella morganii]|uniref:Membrane fusion protein (MFP) family protein n=1 Tax=Morganella morganii TaxID=582 RepID=A0A433ZWZ6_MORMO|nr:HlyD family type I secretion periplasmic adaptor subunit [Morganella morganii]RUT66635.1 secretion protein HlyD [Morganella morganii]